MNVSESHTPESIASMEKSLEESCHYLLAQGVNKGNIRLKAYRNFLNSLKNGHQQFEPVVCAKLVRDIHELIWVISFITSNRIEIPSILFQQSLDGDPLEKYESDKGRNYFLEIRASAYFLRLGYSVTLLQDCDVVATRNKRRIFVECKRLYSERKVRDRVKECYKQLDKRLTQADQQYKNVGLAWIDPSPVMQKNFFAYCAYSPCGIRYAARMDLSSFWELYLCQSLKGMNKRIFATVLQMVSPSWVGLSSSMQTTFTSYVIPNGRSGFWNALRARRLLDEIFELEEITINT